jgi:signal transduction histidine kinase/ActR/RegA family two-component response regulator
VEQFLRALNALAAAGLLIQVVGAAMLWLLFHIIRRQVSDRRYFRFWTVSWGFFALAFLALAIRYRLLTTGDFNLLLAHEDQPLVRALYATYQITKLWGVGFMVVGSLSFNQIRSPRWPVWMGALAFYAIISLLAVPTFEGALAIQAMLVTPLYAFAAWPFLRAKGDRSLGRMLTGVMLVALAALWAVYGINYASSYWTPELGRVFPTPFADIMPVSTLLDTVGMILLAFGMVLVLTEDLRLETDNYRTVLSERLAQTQKMEAVGRLVSGVAHELNNPLAAILAFSEEMLSEFRPPREREALEVIRDQSRRARTIVRDLLTFVGRREERWEQLTPASLLERVARGVTPEFQRRGASLEIAIAPDCPIIVADRAGLEQVVTNLLSNAAYAAGPGGKVVLGATRTAENGLRITVTDNGAGVPTELRARLFEPFFTTKPAGQGTGLGLSVSLGVVEQHHGTIEIESPTNGGARFVVTLPQGTVPAPAVTPTTTVTPVPRAAGAVRPSSVLVIDDEASVRMAMRRWFERMGWTVDEAVDGAQGLALLLAAPSESTYGLVLCDLRMPGMSGIELHTRLLEQRPGVIDRIIFATGDTASPETAAFLARVERPVLEKPFELSQLAAVVEATAGVR